MRAWFMGRREPCSGTLRVDLAWGASVLAALRRATGIGSGSAKRCAAVGHLTVKCHALLKWLMPDGALRGAR